MVWYIFLAFLLCIFGTIVLVVLGINSFFEDKNGNGFIFLFFAAVCVFSCVLLMNRESDISRALDRNSIVVEYGELKAISESTITVDGRDISLTESLWNNTAGLKMGQLVKVEVLIATFGDYVKSVEPFEK